MNPIVGDVRASADRALGMPHGLKAQTNMANGGIGVSYSNVVLAGGMDARQNPSNFQSKSISIQNYERNVPAGERLGSIAKIAGSAAGSQRN